jgi:hypothetical protein
MAIGLRKSALAFVASTCCALVAAGSAEGQNLHSPRSAGIFAVASGSVTDVAATVDAGPSPGQAFSSSRRHRAQGTSPAATGAAIGIVAAAGLTLVASARLGENDTVRICGACFVRWSLITVPVGAGAGAAIGWGVGRLRRSVTAVPLFSPDAAGVAVVARF